MNRVRVRLFPGLRRSWIPEADPLPASALLRRFHCSFPPHPTSLLATLATGQPPSVHGIFGEDALGAPGVVLPAAAHGFELSRDDRWLQAALADPSTDTASSRGWLNELEAGPPGPWILIGAPSARMARRFVDPRELLAEGATHRAEGGVLRIERALSRDERDALLRHDGIERVLFGEARRRRGLDHPEAGETVVLAETDVTFREGDPLYSSDEECWIALIGEAASERRDSWPNAVHDLRIAPTVAAWLGLDVDGYTDKALP